MITQVLLDLLAFIKKPNDQQASFNVKNKIYFFLILFFCELIVVFLIAIPLLLLADTVLNISTDKINYSDTLFKAIVFFVIVIPIIEELIFRYVLRFKGLKIKLISEKKWSKLFPFLVYIFVFCFGYAHLFNYQNNTILFYILSPLIVLPQLIGGFIITFIRVRLSFSWGIIYHCTWNLFVILIFPAITLYLTNPFIETNTNQSLTIDEQLFFKPSKSQEIIIDSSNGKLYSLQTKQYSIQHILDTIYGPNTYYVDDVLINLSFKSKNGVSFKDFMTTLHQKYTIIKK